MRTLGVDLSADADKTAACLITWSIGRAEIEEPVCGLRDEPLLERMTEADWVGIDAPFGWPAEFVDAVSAWAERGTWTEVERERLRYRETDRFVQQTARLPLSVSSDRIAVTAMRCASLLGGLGTRHAGPGGRIDRSGGDQVVEVYPGAALPQWSDVAADLRFDPRGYKGKDKGEQRKALLDRLQRAAAWLELDAATRAVCVDNDDTLDALLCSLIARTAARGLTLRPETGRQRELAPVEGWIHLPRKGSLAKLVDG